MCQPVHSPPVPLFTLRRTPRGVQRKTRGRAVRYSFLVGLFHSLIHAGLARRTALAIYHSSRSVVSVISELARSAVHVHRNPSARVERLPAQGPLL